MNPAPFFAVAGFMGFGAAASFAILGYPWNALGAGALAILSLVLAVVLAAEPDDDEGLTEWEGSE